MVERLIFIRRMKKNFLRIIVAITTTLSLLAACGGNATSNTQTANANTNETKVEANAGETKQSETKYKDTILPYDQLVQGRKIVFLQNALFIWLIPYFPSPIIG